MHMRNVRRLVALAALALLLVGCPSTNGVATVTRIVLFETVPSSVARGAEVTVRWEVEGAGSRTSLASCTLSRQVEGEVPQEPFAVACTSVLTEVPPAGASATYVHYVLSTLKSPYDAADPYLTSQVTVTINGGTVETGPFQDAIVLAETTGPRQRYNREFVAVDDGRSLLSRTRTIGGTLLEGAVMVHERTAPGSWTLAAGPWQRRSRHRKAKPTWRSVPPSRRADRRWWCSASASCRPAQTSTSPY